MSAVPGSSEYVNPVKYKLICCIICGWTAADRNQVLSLTLLVEDEHLLIIMLFVSLDEMSGKVNITTTPVRFHW